MGIESYTIEKHWNYLLAIERDLEIISRYIEFNEDNFNCYSLEIARILLASGAEVDVVCKQLCIKINPDSSASNINAYRDQIIKAHPNISTFQITLNRFGLNLNPWDEWKKPDGVPLWWNSYNKIKHHRDSQFHQANLKNALNAIAGLFVVTLYLYKEKAITGNLLPTPNYLRVSNHFTGSPVFINGEFGFRYILD